MTTPTSYHGDEIAVIGMACRLPGAPSCERLWDNLCGGVESLAFYSEEELLEAGVDPSLLRSPNFVRSGSRRPAVKSWP